MSRREATPRDVTRHLRALRAMAGAFLLTVPAAAVAGRELPHLPVEGWSAAAVTVAAFLVGLVTALAADRVAQRLLASIKEGYAAHGDVHRLLADHREVYLKVLLLVELVVACGLAVALAGAGPGPALWLHAVAGLLFVLAWPTERKTRLLLRRAEDLRRRAPDRPGGPPAGQ